ncbi:MAG TPA: amidohydrolase family protein [Conexibacter sp.]|nr:amidohydrolase family protein [Conexibacter sp.]
MTFSITDCITHISKHPDNVVGWGPRFLAEDLIGYMDQERTVLGETVRIDQSVVFPALGDTVPTSPLSPEQAHEYVLESVERHPDRLIGGFVANPRRWNDDVADWFLEHARAGRFRMMHLHPSLHLFLLPIDSPSEGATYRRLIFPLFEAAREANVPVYLNMGDPPYGVPSTADFVARSFPDVKIIVGHVGTQGMTFTFDASLLAKRHDNILLESSFGQYHLLIEIVASLGADRLLFGSNTPPNEQTQQLMMVDKSLASPMPLGIGVSDEDMHKIYGGNLRTLLGLDSARVAA